MPHSCDILVLRTTALALERAERTRPIHGTLRFDFTVLTLARVHPCPATRRAPLGRRAKDAEATILRERAAFAELQLVEEQKMFKEIQTMKEKAQLATWAEVSQRSPLTVLVYCGNHGYTRLTSGSRVAHECHPYPPHAPYPPGGIQESAVLLVHAPVDGARQIDGRCRRLRGARAGFQRHRRLILNGSDERRWEFGL